MVSAEAATAYFTPEILAIPPDTLSAYEAECEGLAVYSQYLSEIARQRPCAFCLRGEAACHGGEIADGPGNIYTMLNNADMKFPTIRDEQGDGSS